MYKKLIFLLLLLRIAPVGAQTGTTASALTERDFLGDMPIVLSVSRLAQPLDETPGAVTILDRQFIRMSGARDVVDLLRLVPGFQTTNSYETDAPMATYHGRIDDWANRIQVLVDGRSVYSGFLSSSAGLGLQTLAIDDVDRIEVLRGSNSAAYGARAFLGVVNIVSRDVRETIGPAGGVTSGDNGVTDAGARIGWGDESAMYRISADTRGEDGLRNAFGKSRINRVGFVAQVTPGGGSEVDLRAGIVNIDAGRGSPDPTEYGNAARLRYMGSQFLQLDWRKNLTEDQDLALTASHTENTYRDSFRYLDPAQDKADYFGIPIEASGREFNDAVTLQHTVRHSSTVRTVWGAELRREQVISRTSFDDREQVTTDFIRLFGNAEWRMSPALILNAGLLAEHSDIGGDTVSPRVMLNWHVTPGHTLRAGVSTGFRPPSAFEKYGVVKYRDVNGAQPLTYVLSTGNVTPEHIFARELGYYLNLPSVNISADVRVFNEYISDGIWCTTDTPSDCVNKNNYSTTGAEYQVTWMPVTTTRVILNQTWTDVSGAPYPYPLDNPPTLDKLNFRISHAAPRFAGSLTVMHTLPTGVTLSLMHNWSDDAALMSGVYGQLYSSQRTDVRVGKSFRVGKSNAEMALTIQNLDAPYQDGDRKFYFDRRAMVTLRFEN
jgi:iron complex outermembrane receptor protein